MSHGIDIFGAIEEHCPKQSLNSSRHVDVWNDIIRERISINTPVDIMQISYRRKIVVACNALQGFIDGA